MYEFKDMIFKAFKFDFRLVMKNKVFCLVLVRQGYDEGEGILYEG